MEAEDWRYKLYLRVVLETFMELLPNVSQEAIARAAGTTAPHFSKILKKERLTPEKFSGLEAGLAALIEDQRGQGESEERCGEAQRLLDGGLDARVRLVMVLSEASSRQEDVAVISSPHDQRALLREILRSHAVTQNTVSDAQAFSLVQAVYPHLSRDELGFAYHALGEAVMFIGDWPSGAARLAAELFQKAKDRRGQGVVSSVLQLIRSLRRQLMDEAVTEAEQTELHRRISELIHQCELLSHVFPVPWHLLAEEALSEAQYTNRIDETNTERIQSAYRRALKLFDRAIEDNLARVHPDRTDRDLAQLYHCRSVCQIPLGDLGDAIEGLEGAIHVYVKLNAPAHIAYNFKWLGLTYLRINDWTRAVWCARAATAIYGVKGVSDSLGNVEDANGALRYIERQKPFPQALSLSPKTNDAIRLVDEYFTLGKRIP